MVGPANFSALPKEDTAAVRVKGELVKPAGHGVGFDPYRWYSSRVEYVRGRDQHAHRGVGL